ncbi:MAG: hypothetical protein ACJAYU_003154 [Bradymonadia bacterium]
MRAIHHLHGVLPIAECRVLSGVAFRTYQLTPDDNHAYDTQHGDARWRWETLAMENYGVLESLAVHLDREFRIYGNMRPVDMFALGKFEFEQGRGVIGRVRHHGGEFVELVAIDSPKGRVETPSAGDIDFSTQSEDPKAFPAGLDAVDTLFVARPQPEPVPASRGRTLREDVLIFAGRHSQSKRELNFAEELFYSSGLRALDVSSSLVESAEDSEEWRAYWSAWASDLAEARAAAAEFFDGELSQAYADAADAVPRTDEEFDWSDAHARNLLARALRDLVQAEERALELLAARLTQS